MVFIHLFCHLLTTTWPVDDQFMHKLTFHPILSLYHQGRREGSAGGQLAPGPKQVGAPNLRNILKLNKAPSKSRRVQGINGCI